MGLDRAGHAELALQAIDAGQLLCRGPVGGLEAELDMPQAGVLECAQARLGEADAGGDQIGVVAQAIGLGDQNFQVLAQGRLATGETDLHGAELAGLAHHVDPLGRAQLVTTVIGKVARVAAEHALQRALVG